MKKYAFWAATAALALSPLMVLAMPAIGITAPKDGVVWETEGRYFVNWVSNEISPSEKTVIMLKRLSDGEIISLASNTVNDGNQIVSLPPVVTAGDYHLVVSAVGASNEVAIKIVTAGPKTKEQLQIANALTAIQDLFDRLTSYLRK